MNRAMLTTLGAAALLALSGSAHAAEPYMWGAGVRLGTTAIPTNYPALWPTRVSKYDVNDDGDPDMKGGQELETSLAKVSGDVIFGGAGYYWLDKNARIGGIAGIDSAKGWSDLHLLGMYHQVLSSGGDIDVLVGGGAGFGTETWKGLDKDGVVDPSETAERLKMNYFPVRAEITTLIKLTDEFAISPTAFGQLNVPGNHVWSVGGEDYDVSGSPFNYPMIGVEIVGLYGDFKPPKKDGPKSGGGKSGGKGGKSGGKGGGGKGGKGGKN